MTVDKTTKEVRVIEKKSQVTSQPQQPQQPQQTQQAQPSTTTVTVDETTGVKTTSTTDSSVIKQDNTVQKIQDAVVKQAPELKNSQIVSSTTKEYETTIENRVVFKSETTSTRVVSVVNKKTQDVKIIDKAPVSTTEDAPSEIQLTKNTIDEVADKDDVLRRAIKFVDSKLPKLKDTKPSSVSYEELPNIIRYTLVYSISSTNYRVVVIYTKTTKSFELVEQPSEVQDVKPVVLEQETTSSGKKVVFTNDVDSLTKIDTNYQQMIKELTKDFKLTQDDISSVKSTQTSTGNTYSIITTKGTDTNQVDVIYNKETKQVKVLDVATVPQKFIQPTPRPTTTVPKVDYNNDDIVLIIKKSVEDFNVPSFTVSQIIKIEKSKTPFGFNYVIEIDTIDGKAVLIATISTDRKVNVVR